jgi:hypothetical protein
MKAQTTVEIGGITFRISPFDAFTQLRLFGDLQKEILPAVGGVLNVTLGSEKNLENSDAAAIAAFRDLSSNFDGATLEKWATKLLQEEYITFEVPGMEPQKLSPYRRGEAFPDLSYLLELMFHVGKVNFAAPLARWAALSGVAQTLKEKLSASSAQTLQKKS